MNGGSQKLSDWPMGDRRWQTPQCEARTSSKHACLVPHQGCYSAQEEADVERPQAESEEPRAEPSLPHFPPHNTKTLLPSLRGATCRTLRTDTRIHETREIHYPFSSLEILELWLIQRLHQLCSFARPAFNPGSLSGL